MASRTKPRDEIEHTVKEAERLGRGTATPERLRRAYDEDGKLWEKDADRQLISDSPINRLFKRKLLHTDPELNARYYEAAKQYFKDWFEADMLPLRGRDYRNPHTQPHEVGVPRAFSADKIMAATIRHRRAKASMSWYFSSVVDRVVLAEHEPELVGAEVTGRTDGAQARAVALDRLCEGLRLLALHYGITRFGS